MNEKIFVSYNRHDSEFALKLADDLVNQGINIWIDQRNISPGFRWDQELEKALSSSEVVLVILSPFSVASENVLDEVSFAIDAQKRIIPIIAKQCNIPLRLKRFQYIEFNLNYSGGLSRLIAELKKDAPLPPPAPEPDDGKHDDLDIDKKKKSKILKYILVGVFLIIAILIIWLLTNNQGQPGTEIKPYQPEQINVACNASPNKIPAGGETELRVKVYAEQGNPLANANVRIEMGGGRFSMGPGTRKGIVKF